MFANCGSVSGPESQTGEGAAACADVLGGHALFAVLVGALGLAALAAGITLVVRNAR